MSDKTNLIWALGGVGAIGFVGWALLRKPKRGAMESFEASESCADFELDAGPFIKEHDKLMYKLTNDYVDELTVTEADSVYLDEVPNPIELSNRYLKEIAPTCPTPPPPGHAAVDIYKGVMHSSVTWLNMVLYSRGYEEDAKVSDPSVYFQQLGY